MVAQGLDVKYLQASWEEKVRKYRERVELIKTEMTDADASGANAVAGGGSVPSICSQTAQSAISGRFVGVADTSGSMTGRESQESVL